jgi:hypothetical protein
LRETPISSHFTFPIFPAMDKGRLFWEGSLHACISHRRFVRFVFFCSSSELQRKHPRNLSSPLQPLAVGILATLVIDGSLFFQRALQNLRGLALFRSWKRVKFDLFRAVVEMMTAVLTCISTRYNITRIVFCYDNHRNRSLRRTDLSARRRVKKILSLVRG